MTSASIHTSVATRVRPRLDLRADRVPDVLAEVARAFGVHLDIDAGVIKRRSIGTPTDRDTWVRLEARPLDRVYGQTPNGVEAAALVPGVARPAWYRGMSWTDPDRGVLWRADETQRITAAPISTGGILTRDPQLPEAWWQELTRSLTALGAARPSRVASVHTTPISQDRITTTITAGLGEQVDTTITDWGGVHGDLAWVNLTGPQLWILDWEDYGRGPRGLDQATLWAASLAVPDLAARLELTFADVFATHTGRVCQLFCLAELLAAPPEYAGPLRAPAEAHAAALLNSLR